MSLRGLENRPVFKNQQAVHYQQLQICSTATVIKREIAKITSSEPKSHRSKRIQERERDAKSCRGRQLLCHGLPRWGDCLD